MLFSEHFDLAVSGDETWFDPILSIDTKLFLDPFLLYDHEEGPFVGSHEEVVRFFNTAFKLIARSKGDRTSHLYRKAHTSLVFPEVPELCLGYTSEGTKGSGSGSGFASLIAAALWEAIEAGLKEITHFEEIGILREGIGADRISDITAQLLRRRLAIYTREVCRRHKVPMKLVRYARGQFDAEEARWKSLEVDLPRNPYNRNPILLVPRRYLRDLPTLNADDFWDYCRSNENETLRADFNHDVSARVRKHEIVDLARRHPELRGRYLRFRERHKPRPYDLLRDPRGLYRWHEKTGAYCEANPLKLRIGSTAEFAEAVRKMVETFRHYIQENGGWELLWNEDSDKPRAEESAQKLFLGIVSHYCRANDIDVNREVELGRGPVDFKFSRGYSLRALLEVKLAKNTKFWQGLRAQLPAYQKADEVDLGYFLVVVYSDEDAKRIKDIQKVVEAVKASKKRDIRAIVVDARRDPPSASKLRA